MKLLKILVAGTLVVLLMSLLAGSRDGCQGSDNRRQPVSHNSCRRYHRRGSH